MPRTARAKDQRLGGLAERLRALAEQHGGISELAQKANVAVSSLSRCGRGAEPTLATALAICSATGTSLDWLATGIGTTVAAREEYQIPFYDIEASAGRGIYPPEDQRPSGAVAIPARFLRDYRVKLNSLCALQATGDSMEPTIPNGALLVVDRTGTQPSEGIYVISRGDVLMVKRLQPRKNHTMRIASDNKRYEPEDISAEDPMLSLQIFGRVIWSGHTI